MAGVKYRSGGWNKREEFEWRDLWGMSKTELVRLAKKYKKYRNNEIDGKDRLYIKWLDISSAIFIKGIPVKIDGAGHNFTNININITGTKEDHGSNGKSELEILGQTAGDVSRF